MRNKQWTASAIAAASLILTGCMSDAGSETGPAEIESSEHAIWSNAWELIGGTPPSGYGPGVSQWGPGHNLDVFWRGSDNHLKHKWFPYNNNWSWEQDLGGTLTSDPAAMVRPTNMRDVYWRGSDNHLKHKWYPYNGDWSWEEDLGGNMASAPAAMSWGSTAMHVFWMGSDGYLKHKSMSYATNVWTSEENTGIAIQGEPAAMYRNNGIMDVFWRGSEGHVKHVWYPYNGGWSWVQDLGGNIASGSSPTATRRWDGFVDIFWRGTDNHLKHKWYPYNNDWSWEEDLGGNLSSSPDATSWSYARIDVFARDASSGQMAHKLWDEDVYVPLIGQQESNWCWAASGRMIQSALGKTPTAQCTQADHAFQSGKRYCCDANGNPDPTHAADTNTCNKPGHPDWKYLGFSSYSTKDLLTLTDMQNEVSAKRPWAHLFKWLDAKTCKWVSPYPAHWRVGIDQFRFNNDDWVALNDPSPVNSGNQYMEPYSTYDGVPCSTEKYGDDYQIR